MAVKIISYHFQVFPRLTLFGRIAEQVRGMEGGHYFDPLVLLKASAQSRDAFTCVEQVLHRGVAEHDDHFRLHDCDLAEQIRLAGRGFFSRGSAIAWRPAAI